MSKVPFIGGFNELSQTQSANEHSINIMVEKSQGKTEYRMAATPGLRLFTDLLANGPARAAIECSERGFLVAGSGFYEIFADGTFILRGTLLSSTGRVTIDTNGIEIVMSEGPKGYVFTIATNAFVQITDTDWYPSSSLAVVDGYAVFVRDGSQQFFHSDLYAATVYLGLDFETADSNPDMLVAVVNDSIGLAAIGTRSLEFYWDSGVASLVFQRRQGSKISYGCVAVGTALEIDNGIVFLSKDAEGAVGVLRVSGGAPRKLSSVAVDKWLREHGDKLSGATAWGYKQDGATFYVLNIPGADTTMICDLSTSFWHERRSFNSGGVWGRWLAEYHLHVFGKTLVGSYADGKIFQIDPTYYFDNDQIIRRERVLKPIYDDTEGVYGSFNSLTFDCLVGVGLKDPPYDNPVMVLEVSDDGGIHYGIERSKPLGRMGETKTKVQFRRLGVSRNRAFKVIYAFPTPFAINNVMVDADE